MLQPGLLFDAAKHEYFWYGKKVPSVTQILHSVGTLKKQNDGSEMWKPIGFDNRFTRDDIAANFGTAFHKVASIILTGGIPSFPPAMEPFVRVFRQFLSDFPIVVLQDKLCNPLVEYLLYSERYGYAGTPDAVVLAKGGAEVWLLDWKTSTTFQNYWNFQTAAYEQLIKEVLGIKKKIIRKVIRFTDTRYFVQSRTNNPEDWAGFQSCLNLLRMAA